MRIRPYVCNNVFPGVVDDVDRFFDRALRGFARGIFSTTQEGLQVAESEDSYEYQIDVPGFKKEEVNISLTEDSISIQAESGDREGGAYRKVERTYPLPKETKREEITAKLENGVLVLTFPKVEGESNSTRKIEIK